MKYTVTNGRIGKSGLFCFCLCRCSFVCMFPFSLSPPYLLFFFLLLLQLRIDDAGVVDGLELLLEDRLDRVDLLEGDRGLFEDALPDLVGDDLLDKVVDTLVRVFLQASGGRLHGVAHD